jgi:hypothetical protein
MAAHEAAHWMCEPMETLLLIEVQKAYNLVEHAWKPGQVCGG